MNVPHVTKKCPKSGTNGTGRDSRARIGKRDIVPSHFVSRNTVPLSQAQRFSGWLAGASAEQQARWERMQAAEPVKDEQLPPALRGGVLESF